MKVDEGENRTHTSDFDALAFAERQVCLFQRRHARLLLSLHFPLFGLLVVRCLRRFHCGHFLSSSLTFTRTCWLRLLIHTLFGTCFSFPCRLGKLARLELVLGCVQRSL